MKAFDFLKRHHVGQDDKGRKVFSKRSYRGFFIALFAGERAVVLNATIVGMLEVDKPAIISGTKIVAQ